MAHPPEVPIPGDSGLPLVMEPHQEDHLARILDAFERICDRKYRIGQHEHGGDLHKKSTAWLLDQAILEAVDQVVYLLTIREQLDAS